MLTGLQIVMALISTVGAVSASAIATQYSALLECVVREAGHRAAVQCPYN